MRIAAADVWTSNAHALWERISQHPFENSDDGLDFTRRLAREQAWSLAQARRAIEEYRRYCFLACVAGREMTPSLAVDEVWHLHLTYTRDYWKSWCPQVLQCTLHHGPTRGGRAEASRHRDQYADTLAEYERWFGAPPADIWPGTAEQFAAIVRMRRVDLARHIVLPRPRWPLGLGRTLLALIAPLLLSLPAQALPANPLDWEGGPFLQLYLLLMLIAFIGSIWLRRSLRERGAGSGASALDAFELAYLADGPTRCTDAAVTRLLQDDLVVWDADAGKLRLKGRVSDLDPPLDGIAKCIAVDGKPADLVKRSAPVLETVRKRLMGRGLYLDDAQVARVRWLGCLPLYAVMGLGVAKMLVGASRDKPIGFLVFLTIVLAVITLIFWAKRPARTRAGDRALSAAQVRHKRAARAPRGEELALAVALGGTAILGSTAYASYHQARHPPNSSDSGSSSGDSGSSSDGGGDGGGGGGCGGCGGGGD